MERTLNKVELKGRVGADPKVTEISENATIIRFSVAENTPFSHECAVNCHGCDTESLRQQSGNALVRANPYCICV